MTHAAASAVYPARRLHCCAHRLFPRPLPASSVARPYVAALSSRRRGVPLLHSSRRFASTSSPPSTTSAPPPPPRPPSPPSPHVPHPLSYSRGADLTSAELDAVLRSSRRSPSSSSASSAAAEESELSALQSELAAEVAFDRRMASETVAQRIVRRLRRRQLGWKLLALLLAMAAMAASLQLLTLKQRSRAEGDAAEVLLTRLREEGAAERGRGRSAHPPTRSAPERHSRGSDSATGAERWGGGVGRGLPAARGGNSAGGGRLHRGGGGSEAADQRPRTPPRRTKPRSIDA